jgi:hypothetical protein
MAAAQLLWHIGWGSAAIWHWGTGMPAQAAAQRMRVKTGALLCVTAATRPHRLHHQRPHRPVTCRCLHRAGRLLPQGPRTGEGAPEGRASEGLAPASSSCAACSCSLAACLPADMMPCTAPPPLLCLPRLPPAPRESTSLALAPTATARGARLASARPLRAPSAWTTAPSCCPATLLLR